MAVKLEMIQCQASESQNKHDAQLNDSTVILVSSLKKISGKHEVKDP